MAYIQPNSTILLIRGVPFEPDYDHTVLFPDASSQATVIHGSAKYTLNPNTYQRVNKNTCRVGLPADNLYDCNYMAFQNTAFGSKWFYAFIKEVNYINNECTEIVYEIDSFQSYLFDFRIGDCFVEREHPITDELFQNYVPESINTGELMCYGTETSDVTSFARTAIFILVAPNDPDIQGPGNLIDNTFQGGTLFCFPIEGDSQALESRIKTFLTQFNNQPERVLSIYTGPLLNQWFPSTGGRYEGSYASTVLTWTPNNGSMPSVGQTSFDGYVPRNNKLYTYPYNFYCVTNGQGSSLDIKYEYCFAENQRKPISFAMYCASLSPCEMCIYPRNYKNAVLNKLETLSLKGWGQGSWTGDTYSRLLNTTAIDAGISVISGFLKAGLGVAVGGLAGAGGIASGTNGIIEAGARIASVVAKKDYISPTTYGDGNSGSALASSGQLDFIGCRMGVSRQFAEIIDNYFDMYGYQTNRLKTPEINSRPHWNYVKVSYADVHGNVPAEHIVNIKNALRRGITFWKSMSEVGHYEYDNRPY